MFTLRGARLLRLVAAGPVYLRDLRSHRPKVCGDLSPVMDYVEEEAPRHRRRGALAAHGEMVSVPTLIDGMRALEAVEAAEESARSGSSVLVAAAQY